MRVRVIFRWSELQQAQHSGHDACSLAEAWNLCRLSKAWTATGCLGFNCMAAVCSCWHVSC